MDLPLDCCSGSGEALVDLPRCARRGFRCAPRLRRAPQSGDAHSKRATGPLWIPRRESPCDPARRAGILRGCLRRMPGARYARRPLAGAPPRGPGLSPLRGPGPAGRILYQDGLRPNPCDPSAASGWPSAKVGGARFTDERTGVQHPARRRAAGAMPLPENPRNRTGSASREALTLLRGAQRPRGGGKPGGTAARARRAHVSCGPCPQLTPRSVKPMRVRLPGKLAAHSVSACWERLQPELSPQLVYPWGAAVVCGLWQGTPGDS